MANTYYSGQGRFYVAERHATTGAPMGFTELGNIPSLSIDIETTKYEHKESQTGNRAVDLSIIQEKKGTFTMTLENINGFNLALALWGNTAVTGVTAITDEQIVAYHDLPVPLAQPNVNSTPTPVVGDDAVPTTTYTVDVDYTIDLVHGTITALSTGSITDGQTIFVDYTPKATTKVEAFTESSMERWLRFEGLNTIDGSSVVVDMFKASFDPLTGYGLINEEIAAIELTGNVLLDDLQPSNGGTSSQFFRQFSFDPAV